MSSPQSLMSRTNLILMITAHMLQGRHGDQSQQQLACKRDSAPPTA